MIPIFLKLTRNSRDTILVNMSTVKVVEPTPNSNTTTLVFGDTPTGGRVIAEVRESIEQIEKMLDDKLSGTMGG